MATVFHSLRGIQMMTEYIIFSYIIDLVGGGQDVCSILSSPTNPIYSVFMNRQMNSIAKLKTQWGYHDECKPVNKCLCTVGSHPFSPVSELTFDSLLSLSSAVDKGHLLSISCISLAFCNTIARPGPKPKPQ